MRYALTILLAAGLIGGCASENVSVPKVYTLDVQQTQFPDAGVNYQYCVKCSAQTARSVAKHHPQA